MEPAPTLELSILIPCLNESETIQTCVVKAQKMLERANISGEVLVADNGSTDGSAELASAAGARVVHVPQRGYGAALIGGINAAWGKYIIVGDADDSYDFLALDPFIEQLRGGIQLVIGSRFKGQILPGAMPPLHRWLGNPVLTFIGNVMFGTRISDYHCGLRGFDRERMRSLELRTLGMELATEMIVKAALYGLSICEVPITYYPDGRTQHSHLRTWQDGWRHLKLMLIMSPLWVFIVPGITFILPGLLGYLEVVTGSGADVTRLSRQLVASIALIVGSQLLIFGLLARLFAIKFGLLPSRPIWEKLATLLSIDNGLLVGGLLCLVGLPVIVQASSLNDSYNLIIGLLLFVFGTKIVFTSFVVSMIRIKDYFR